MVSNQWLEETYNVDILSSDALLHLHGNLTIVEAANSTISHLRSEALGNAVGKSSVAVSRHDLQLVASGNELVLQGARMETGITTTLEILSFFVLARAMEIQTGDVQRILILRVITDLCVLPQQRRGGFRRGEQHHSRDQQQRQIRAGKEKLSITTQKRFVPVAEPVE